jgi:hypothetical protein
LIGRGLIILDRNLLNPPILNKMDTTASDSLRNLPSVKRIMVSKSELILFFVRKFLANSDCRFEK